MKFFLIAFAVIAAVAADVSHLPSNDYLPPQQESFQTPSNEYLAPVQQAAPAPVQYAPAPVQYAPEPEPAHEVAQDGYRYKTNRRVVYRRHRRDVSHLPSNDYLPPQQESFQTPSNDYLPPVQQAAPAPVQYAPAPVQYAPAPVQYAPAPVHHAPAPVQYAPAPVQYAPEPEPSHELAQDGYRYKTHRRVVYRRHRRDVSHLPSNDYLPPQQEQAAPVEEVHYEAPVAQVQQFSAPVAQVEQYSAPVEAEPAHELAQDGYRYKTHRRVVYRRHRRDVSHLPSNDYLPPQQEQAAPVEEVHYEAPVAQVQQFAAPVAQVEQYSAPIEAEPAHELAQDGYRYKTNRRVVYRRHRRDVSHLPSNDYLPPQQESFQTPSNDYLPPVQQAAPAPVQYAPAPVQYAPAPVQYAPAPVHHAPAPVQYSPAPVQYAPEPEPSHELAQDGYRYKTHRRVVYRRHRRDVSHLPSNDYLPPQQEQAAPVEEVHYEAPAAQVEQYSAPIEAEPSHELAQDGYRYKTQRRVVYRRHRRDVSHLPSNDYLPPQQEQAAPVEEVHYEAPVAQVQQYSGPVEAEPAHELAQDGYRYKTHRRVVYRRH